MAQIPLVLPIILILTLSILLQLRLSSLGLSPIKFSLPDLPSPPPPNDRLANVQYEKIGEDELVYPECYVEGRSRHVQHQHHHRGDHVKEVKKSAFLSLGDGRIVRLDNPQEENPTWYPLVRTGTGGHHDNVDYDYNDEWKKKCGKGGPADTNTMEHKCGRPLGLWMSNRASVDPNYTAESSSDYEEQIIVDEDVLLVADAYMGLLMITGIYNGGSKEDDEDDNYVKVEVHTLATRAKTDPPEYKFTLLNALVQVQDDVYLTETSQKFQRRRIFHAAMDGTPTGRLLRYRRRNDEEEKEGSGAGAGYGEVEVLAENIYMANGLALSHDGASLLIVSGVSILRYDLLSNQMDDKPFVQVMPGTGDNIKAMDQLPNGTKMKCYWMGLGGKYTKPFSLLNFIADKPWLASLILAVVPYRVVIELIPKWTALAVYDERGMLVETLIDDGGSSSSSSSSKGSTGGGDGKKKGTVDVPWISEVEPVGDYLYLMSWYNPFLARIKKSSVGK